MPFSNKSGVDRVNDLFLKCLILYSLTLLVKQNVWESTSQMADP